MCQEESDDPEAVHKLLEINDSIHRTIERYTLIKSGDVDAASRIPKGTLGTTTGVSKNANNELSLIDMDPEPASDPTGGCCIWSCSGGEFASGRPPWIIYGRASAVRWDFTGT